MNNAEAKFVLHAYRPNGADAADAVFHEALQQVQRDPGLQQWFTRQQAFDAAVGAKLAGVAAPAGLREAILAGGRATTPVATTKPWWRSQVLLAAAAGIAVLFSVGLAFWPKTAVARGSLGQFALADARHSETHGGHGANTDALQVALNNPANRLGQALPVDFAALQHAGCRSVSFAGHEVLEVCFKRDGVWFHCYIFRRSDFPALATDDHPVLTDRDGATLATWSDAAHLFVVVSKAGRAPLERLL